MPLDLVVSGTWKFKDSDALKTAGKVLKTYLELTGYKLPDRSTIMIAPLPVTVGSTKWRAETRGSTVLLLIDPAASFNNWIGQLGVIFTHELLHLWVPNSLRLDGDYDWFFEGFTLYTALRTALTLKIINFKEFLDTLARVYDSYLAYPDDLSLIDAAERRWTTSGSFVYDKGMLAAFLYDLLIRSESAGKITLADKYRELFARTAADHVNGNEVIIAVLGSSPAAKDFARSYIENSTRLELERLLPAYGLTLDSSGKTSQLRVSRALSSDQKRLLRSLGLKIS
jgi:predicted metalloprotease with PDZ domain